MDSVHPTVYLVGPPSPANDVDPPYYFKEWRHPHGDKGPTPSYTRDPLEAHHFPTFQTALDFGVRNREIHWIVYRMPVKVERINLK